MAEGARHSMAFVAESTYGTTPATPTLTNIRHKSTSLKLARETEPSGELGREVKNLINGPRTTSGDVVAELSYGSFDDIIEAVLGGTWGSKATMTASTISAAAADNSFNDSGNGFLTAGFEVGMKVDSSGFTGDPANNASFVITALTAGKMTFGGTDGDVIVDDAAGESVTITSQMDRVTVGNTKRSFTVERHFADVSDKPYHRYTGWEWDTMAMTFSGEGKSIEVSFGGMGKDKVSAASAISGSTYSAATTTVPMEAFSGVLKEGGSAIAVVTEMALNVANNKQARIPVGNGGTGIQAANGKALVTGTVTFWFEDNTYYDKFLNATDSSLEITVTDAAGNDIRITLPALQYTDAPIEVSDDGPVTVAMPFHAKYGSAAGSTVAIDRSPA